MSTVRTTDAYTMDKWVSDMICIFRQLLVNSGYRQAVLLLTCLIISIISRNLYAQTENNDVAISRIDPIQIHSIPLYVAIDPSSHIPEFDQRGLSLPAEFGMNLRVHDVPYMTETVETVLNPRNEVEFMVHIDEGEVILYTWEADEPLYYDLHGHLRGGNPDIWTRYTEGKADQDQGSIVIPYSGDHGWYWVNLGSKPVNIRLTVTGYYKEIFKIDLSEPQY